MTQYMDTIGNPLVPAQYVVAIGIFIQDFMKMFNPNEEIREKARYQKSTPSAKKGELKIWNDALRILPYIGKPLIQSKAIYRELTGKVVSEMTAQEKLTDQRSVAKEAIVDKALEEQWPLDKDIWEVKIDSLAKDSTFRKNIESIFEYKKAKSVGAGIVRSKIDSVLAIGAVYNDFFDDLFTDKIAYELYKEYGQDSLEINKFINDLYDIEKENKIRRYTSKQKKMKELEEKQNKKQQEMKELEEQAKNK